MKSDSNSVITISLPFVASPYSTTAAPKTSALNPESRNCDNFNSGKFDRLTTLEGFLYTAENANSCDQINLKHLPHDINYAILADIKNESGLSPTICFENYSTRRCDVHERLINGLQMIIQPISNPNETPGYTLHFSNQSFGSRKTTNLLKSLTITPFPLQFLKNITLTGFSSDGGAEGDSSEVKPVVSASHPAEFLYTADISWDGDASTDEGSSRVISLYQTRSPYWKALEVSEADLALPTWQLILKLPLLYLNNNQLPPVTISNTNDSWHNNWQVSPGPHHLAIFYLPQYLEFLGLTLLPLPLIGIILYALIRKPRRKE